MTGKKPDLDATRLCLMLDLARVYGPHNPTFYVGGEATHDIERVVTAILAGESVDVAIGVVST